MPRTKFHNACLLVLSFVGFSLPGTPAERRFHHVSGQEFDYALPRDFYLEGKAIPSEKRNAAMLRTAHGQRLLFALLDTSGYSSQSRQKYMGMMITEARVSLCERPIEIGSYGFGLSGTTTPGSDQSRFTLYDQAGESVASCLVKRDNELKQPKPLQLLERAGDRMRLYLGRYWLEVQ